MEKIKKYVGTQFDKVKRSASNIIGDKQESGNAQEEDASIEVTPLDYERLKHKALRERTTVQELINRAIHNLLNEEPAGTKIQLTEEQKQRNPLLYLDGLTRRNDFALGSAPVAASREEGNDHDGQ
ncbi:hypothetical protein [Paenibacillus sp. J2TS4]|uniref:hypothetical protein n=1 Tax=Paenibacillus sp. J2TS4 TaxID=2807194 RepID=UPI001B23B006|nr:hypothetical protein [Paenibacillus sp. J2TS4]GIP34550.1 hypothetical protein J2TS4_37600 [Paenibacillus sp. J2TS4]